ncbi:MAG: nucleotide exchange factor GrpE [Clostridia bacterium]|nr:nucleotide exchange factor GrpE [Clostridia bacterium]
MSKKPKTDAPEAEEKDIPQDEVNTKASENTEETKAAEETSAETVDEKTPLEKAEESIANLSDRLMRTAAEFDNFKKRSQREKDEVYSNAVCDTVEKLLPVLDNLERAITASVDSGDDSSVLEGIKMVKKQFEDSLSAIGVVAIDAVGKAFDPEKHNAVMTAESDEEENTVLEEFMKGYLYKDKVVRHSMVKVSN